MDTKQKKRSVQTRRRPVQPESKRQATKTAPAPKKRPVRRVKKPVRQERPTQEVVYTQPGPFNRNRFLLRLATVLAVVLALVFGMSIFFKVKTVNVSGVEKYTAWQVREASGIQEGENLLGLSRAKLSSLIEADLPYVESVRIGIKLPDTVNIEIRELDVVYAVEASDGSWWLMRSDGMLVEKTDAASAGNSTKLLGFKVSEPQVGAQAVAWEEPPEQTTPDGQTVPVTVENSQRLAAALSIVQYLEENNMIGVAASVNAQELGNLEFWYGDRYQVQLGDSSRMAYKITSAKSAIDQMGQYQSGILDVSFTVEIDGSKERVIYTPFS